MAKCLVTGAAGFIGSHLCDKLIRDGHEVVGIDSFTENYPKAQKESNLSHLLYAERFSLLREDVLTLTPDRLPDDVEYVFHLAGQPGVRASWGQTFDVYVNRNVLATQRLLELARKLRLRKVLYASSSSIYGDAESFPTSETALPRPVSPYGVTKLAGEHLCYLYSKSFGLPTVSVRYFTVYGPRQRPDMAFHRFICASLAGQPVAVFGDGGQTRDFTYIEDAVDGTIAAAFGEEDAEVFNIGGGSRVSVNEVLRTVEAVTSRKLAIDYVEAQAGDARHTSADIRKARARLGFAPKVDLAEGLRNQALWIQENGALSCGHPRI